MTKYNSIAVVLIFSLFAGCLSAAVESGHIVVDNVQREKYQKDAEKGDKVAQYELGDSYCCSTSKSGPAYDTTVSVHWLCLSARQGYAPAMYKLGKIYSGDVIDGLRLLRRAATGVTEAMNGDTVSKPTAYAWLKLASTYGNNDARNRFDTVKSDMSPSEIKKGEALAAQGLSIPCEMKDVF